METENKNTEKRIERHERRERWKHRAFQGSRSGRVFGGLIVVCVGIVILAKRTGADIPYWLISWPMIPIVVGLYIGVRHSFKGFGWLIPIIIGTVFLIDLIDPSANLRTYAFPIIIIIVGIILMLKPSRGFRGMMYPDEKPTVDIQSQTTVQTTNPITTTQATNPQPTGTVGPDDFLDSVTIFGGLKKNIFSKTFRGGDIVTIFGGTELNLTQADVPHRIVLDITQIFGGAKIIIPPHWRIHSEDVVSIFGSVEDKRPILPDLNYDTNKVLVLKGTNIFGGIDIKSY